jgi:hypothetical protein
MHLSHEIGARRSALPTNRPMLGTFANADGMQQTCDEPTAWGRGVVNDWGDVWASVKCGPG